jgi:parallel beta-helix repeat protein
VSIDLNGFTMTGTGATSTQPAIFIDGASAHVLVRNGAIRNWRQAIQHFIGGSITVDDVHAYGSLVTQFELKNATVVRCRADDGASTGFITDGGMLTDCLARSNTGSGFIILTAATTVRGCSAIGNGSTGLAMGGGVAESCRSESNGGAGFSGPGAMNNCTAVSNSGDGINANFAAVVRACTVVSNGGDGVQVSSGSRIEGNTINSNSLHGVNVTSSRTTVVNNSISTNGRGTGAFAGVQVSGADNCIDGNHITNMLLGADDFGVNVTGTSNLIVRNTISNVSTTISAIAGNTSGGTSTTPGTAGAWVNITY